MTPCRSPWFNARLDPPVNGGDDDVYERKCPVGNIAAEVEMIRKSTIVLACCDLCQWRGLLREGGDE